jgi:hypothetical protein
MPSSTTVATKKTQEQKMPKYCGTCGEPGHNRRTCKHTPPEEIKAIKKSDLIRKRRVYTCAYCGEAGHNKATCTNPPKEVPIRIKRKRGAPAKTYEQYRADIEAKYPGLADELGKVTDTELGTKYGVSRQRIHQFRQRLDVDAFFTPLSLDLTPDQVALLGNRPDVELSEKWDVPAYHIASLRKELKIEAYSPWPEYEKLLAPYRDKIGKISDPQVAEMAGVPTRIVFDYRHRKGIESSVIAPTHAKFKKIDRALIDEMFHDDMSDEEMAAVLGCSVGAVTMIRSQELGLLRSAPRRPITDGEREKIRKVYQNCGSITKTAERCDRSYGAVKSIIKDL